MDTEEPKEQPATSDNNSGSQGSDHGSDSIPNDDVEAPSSGPFKKSITPADGLEAPKSRPLTEGFDFDQPESDDE